jgi:hypothetical protein
MGNPDLQVAIRVELIKPERPGEDFIDRFEDVGKGAASSLTEGSPRPELVLASGPDIRLRVHAMPRRS